MTAHEMLAKVRNLPPISTGATQLFGLLGQPETSNENVIRIIKQDSVLTAKLLRACNSPALGLKAPVTSVDHAVLVLGHRQILRMVTALTFRDPLDVPLLAYSLGAKALWRHSLTAAIAAEMAVASGLNVGLDSSTAFTIGLLHDFGKLVTTQFLTRQALVAARARFTQGRSTVEAEREVLGTDHAEVGGALLYLWRLPAQIVDAVALHHQPVFTPQPRSSALAWFANQIAHQTEAVHSGQQPRASGIDARVVDVLGFNPEQLEELIGRASQAFQEVNQQLLAV
jgi:putative nucleotidyltransferase with HDIG domain